MLTVVYATGTFTKPYHLANFARIFLVTLRDSRLLIFTNMSDPLFGVKWKVDPGISRFSGEWKPDEESRLYEPLENGYKLTVSGRHKGNPYSWGYTAYYDEKKHPVTGRPDVDSVEIYKVNDRITVGFFSKGDEAGGPYARFVSEDGKTLQVQSVGHRADGSVFFDVMTYNNPT